MYLTNLPVPDHPRQRHYLLRPQQMSLIPPDHVC